ncbi:MAG: hypothetical protein RL299_374, partial [Pseudomonadota bacterium]
KIYQGEAREVEANVFLGDLTVFLPGGPADESGVDVRFTYDTSGLLEVDTTVLATGLSQQLLIYDKSDEGLLKGLDQRRDALAALKIHPRDKAANAAASARAARCYEGHLGEMRQYVSTLIAQFENVLATQDERKIDKAREELLARLDEVEGETWL